MANLYGSTKKYTFRLEFGGSGILQNRNPSCKKVAPVQQLAWELELERLRDVASPSRRIRFTGTERGGVSTRVAALPFELGLRGLDDQDEPSWQEVDQAGRPSDHDRGKEVARRNLLLHLLTSPPKKTDIASHGPMIDQPLRLQCNEEGPGAEQPIEIAEQSLDGLIKELKASKNSAADFSALVICLPIHKHPASSEATKILLRLLGERFSTEGSQLPWIIFDITQYERMFQGVMPDEFGRAPGPLALKAGVKKLAIEQFCGDWINSSEVLKLADLERSHRQNQRIVFQVSSAWGFLRGDVPPADRCIANIQMQKTDQGLIERPRIPSISAESAKRLTAMASGNLAEMDWPQNTLEELSHSADLLGEFWCPVGITDPLFTVMQGRRQDGMIPLRTLVDKNSSSGDSVQSKRDRGLWGRIFGRRGT